MITERQKQLVQQSFAKVAPVADQAAAIFYNKLFEYDPSLRSLFKTDLQIQGQKLMQMLTAAVKGLDDLESLVPVLQKLAQRHLKYNVSVDDYTPVGNALLYALEQGLGQDFSPEVRAAWIEVYKTVAVVMRSHAYPEYDPNTYKNYKQYFKGSPISSA